MPDKNNGIIIRSKLLHLFDSLSEERMIYVCAPGGYGKTVSVQQWLDQDKSPRAVISFEDYDNNIPRFCERFCGALLGCQPKNKALAEIVSHPAFGNAPEEFSMRAITTLSGKKRMTIVIDDLHFINNEKVLKMLPIFFKRIPETFRIFLISRNDLPAEFSDLWIKGDLARITTEQLRFSAEEIMLLYQKRGIAITSEQADSICRYTDGWAIGINALLLSGDHPDGEIFGYLDTYIEAHVWRRWNEDVREFLLKTSVLHDMTPAICTELTGIADSEKLLCDLMLCGAFVSQINKEHYCYHRLFLNFIIRMRRERGHEFTRKLLDKAGYWYLAKQDFNSAIQYFTQSENYDGIAECMESLPTLESTYVPSVTLTPIVKLPVFLHTAGKYPKLYSLLTWAAFNDGRAEDMAKYADLYYSHQTEIMLQSPRAVLDFFLVRLIDFRNPLQLLVPAAADISWHIAQKQTTGTITGPKTINQNMPLLHRGTRDFSECAIGDVEANIAGMLKAFGYLFDREANLLAECLMAGLFYEQGYLEKAHSHALAANAEINESFAAETKFFTMITLVYTFDAFGRNTQADRVIEKITDMTEKCRAYHLSGNLEALAVSRKLSNGCIKTARDWLFVHETTLNEDLVFYRIYEYLTSCRAYITAGDFNSAIILLTKVLALLTTYNRPLGIIEAKILLSIAFWKKKRTFLNDAMRHLQEAVSIAYHYGYTQMFVNEGAELCGMLRRLQRSMEQRGETAVAPVNFIKMLYFKALEHQGQGLTSGQTEAAVKFTDKQKAVMKLLCEGKSYREITEIIGIKLPTLRSHISLIYKKLGVTSETDAIMKIKSLGVLSKS